MNPETSLWYALTFRSGLTHSEVHAFVGQWQGEAGRSLGDLFAAKADDLKWAGLTDRQCEGIERARAELPAARAELDPCAVAGVEVVSSADAAYPRRLAATLKNSRPPLLFCIGDLRLLNEPAVAVIGSRKPSEAALRFTAETAERLARERIAVVSGFAEGVDRRASWSALEAGGTTILVLAQGILTLAHEGEDLSRWLERGQVLAMSAFRPRADWQTPLAMARNAMITGMAGDVVVGHSRPVGGAWEAARMALRQGKRVWVRGDLNPSLGHGALASLGARLVEWPPENLGGWVESVANRARDEFAGKIEKRRWTEESAMELLRAGSPADIHEACGITGNLLLRIVEGRERVALERVEDLKEIKGLGEAAVEEIVEAFDLSPEPQGQAQLSLFPEIEEYPGWDGDLASDARGSAARKSLFAENDEPSVFPENEPPTVASPSQERTRHKAGRKERAARRPASSKTNLLVVMASALRADFLGCYGAAAPATPNMDSLASQGALLARAYTTHTDDSPARATFLTGTSWRCHGVWRNGVALNESVRTLASHLAAQGYRTACVGKMHLSPYEAPFEARSKESRAYWEAGLMDRWTGPYHGFNQARLVLGHGTNALACGHYANWLREWHSEELERLSRENAEPGEKGGSGACILNCRPQIHSTHWIADHAAAFLKEYRHEPFFTFCSFPNPHSPYAALREYVDGVAVGNLPSAIARTASQESLPPHLREQAGVPAPSEDRVRQIRTHYAAMVAQIDEAVGFLLAKLDELDLAKRTLVVLTSDHGDLLGDYGLLGSGPFHYGPLIRVPSIWRLPEAVAPGAKLDGVFSHLDFMPTACRLIGSPAPPQSQGRALDAALRGEENAAVRDAALVEYESVSPARLSVKTLVTDDCRMTYYSGEPFGEFYELTDDPRERNNRFGEMSPAERAAAMQSLLDLLSETDTRQ